MAGEPEAAGLRWRRQLSSVPSSSRDAVGEGDTAEERELQEDQEPRCRARSGSARLLGAVRLGPLVGQRRVVSTGCLCKWSPSCSPPPQASAEHLEDADGTKGNATTCAGLLAGLDERLEDLKALYKRKFGMDVDEDRASVAIVTQVSESMFRYYRENPLTVASHLLLIFLLMSYCSPEKGIFPTEQRWQVFPLLALLHGTLRLLRLGLRCTAFTVCMLRCVWRHTISRDRFRGHAWEMMAEEGFSTIWPTEGLANVAFICFFFSRTFTVPWILMEVIVGDRGYEGQCGVVSIVQGLTIRSYWIAGFVLGFRYFKELETRDAPASRVPTDKFYLHPRMWKMIQSPSFHHHACFALLAWFLVSTLECCLFYHWEAGVAGSSQELDAFRYTKEFFEKYHPAFEKWRFQRVVVGNWRESFYFIFMFPKLCSLFAVVNVLLMTTSRFPSFASGPWPWLRSVAYEALLGVASYIICLTAHQMQFFILVLLVSWECYHLQEKFEAFQDSFGSLSSEARLERHRDLGRKLDGTGRRLHPIILFLVLERAIHMSFDVATLRCESSPFTLLHYAFRHIARTIGVIVVIWRIGRLNSSIYDDLSGKVKYLLVCCHEHTGLSEGELHRRRKELKDWAAYLQHNASGHRQHCLRVCGFQCCLHPHTVAGWAVTLALIPAGQKIVEFLPGFGPASSAAPAGP